MKIMRILRSITVIGGTLLMAACNSWLDVKPEDRILEDALYEDRQGFLIALNGVYAEMNEPALYGQNLTVGMLDVMAQYYNCMELSDGHPFFTFTDYDYESSTYKSKFNAIWSKMYTLIANCNALLNHCDDGNEVLTEEYYKLIKGEALGLRAMMHLDLLRMFGPIWKGKVCADTCIPYMKLADRGVQPLLTADSVMSCIINDLTIASDLLITVDPIVLYNSKSYQNENGNKDFSYRQYRLNYYAVQALLARAHLWRGDKLKAGECARRVIEGANSSENALFPLVSYDYMEKNEDNLFSPEVLFSLYNTSRSGKIYKQLYAPDLAANRILSMTGDIATGRIAVFYDDKNDYRYKMWEQTVENNRNVVYFTKYEDNADADATEAFGYMIPLIRISEMYLIAAECETDPEIAMDKYLNQLRFHRNCVNLKALSMDEVQEWVEDEYQREFIGEGQTFFYYKRHGMQNIPDGTQVNGVRNIDLESYVFPLPDSEISQRAE